MQHSRIALCRIGIVLLPLYILTAAAPPPVEAQEGGERLAPLLEGLGDHHHEITTDNALAQRFFDQGLILAFAFNHAEAYRSFKEAARIDPECAMCHWGKALVLGPNINAAMDPDDAATAHAVVQKALRLSADATEREQAYIEALTERYEVKAVVDRSTLDKAYATGMRKVSELYPGDLDAQVLYAEALMTTTPWDYWKPDGEPKPVTEEILAVLDDVLEEDAEHPMANHLYIRAVEARHPEWGLEKAERLQDAVPGAGH